MKKISKCKFGEREGRRKREREGVKNGTRMKRGEESEREIEKGGEKEGVPDTWRHVEEFLSEVFA